ncbi:hypothetical protein SOCE26_071570 [Sorangium cellulosum]|uniref:Tetratricopeptide repeat protein n=1 Tax=Sorangium cellulosum TaxID=56 RepID=A0A2L0F266_SORCE|nr:hypothetical protein [Sorangium cellulosum]AUX45662.1 hypothetical protein SOCE26_071570 [Sorangium cellulosum]
MSRAESVAVKRGKPRSAWSTRDAPGAHRGWKRHFEGWEPGLVAVFIAASAAILAVPRPVEPADLPLPLADARALARTRDADAARAREAERVGLDAEVRELGSAFRAFGVVDADADHTEAELLTARKRVLEAVGPALGQGDEAVLRLRAYQLSSFLREVRRFEATGEETDELRELGGNFVGLLRRNVWLEEGKAKRRGGGAARRVSMDATVLGVLFKKRWSAVVGIQRAPFGPALDEERALFSFLLSHPRGVGAGAKGFAAPGEVTASPLDEGPVGAPGPRSRAAAFREAEARRAEEQYRLKKIDELAALDPAYPKHLARGVSLYRLGKFVQSAEAFRSHLDEHPDGAHALRAQNYLRAALGRARDEQL